MEVRPCVGKSAKASLYSGSCVVFWPRFMGSGKGPRLLVFSALDVGSFRV